MNFNDTKNKNFGYEKNNDKVVNQSSATKESPQIITKIGSIYITAKNLTTDNDLYETAEDRLYFGTL